jgi:hypothetical protein
MPTAETPPAAEAPAVALRLGAVEQAMLLLPWGWVVVWLRLWDAYHAQVDSTAEAAEDAPRHAGYRAANVDWLDQALLLVPYGWPLAAIRHADFLGGDALGIRGALLGEAAAGSRFVTSAWLVDTLASGRDLLARLPFLAPAPVARSGGSSAA